MPGHPIKRLFPITGALVIASSFSGGQTTVDPLTFAEQSRDFFSQYCISCHGEKKQKAELTLHDLAPEFESAAGARRWLDVLDQLESGEMPPEERDQPGKAERAHLVAAIKEQFRLSSQPVAQLRSAPKYGNYLNHEELFSGEHKGPSYSRPRLWRISPYIDGPSSPFSLSQDEGFKDYAHMWSMDKPTLELLLAKARGLVEKQIGPSKEDLEWADEMWKRGILAKRRDLQREYEDAVDALAADPSNGKLEERVKRLDDQLAKNKATDFENHRGRPSAKLGGLRKNVFWRIAYGGESPSGEDLQEAVTRQLSGALRREPVDEEIAKMTSRLRESIATFGSLTGLQVTLTSILLMPEAIFRMELGLGEELPDGRRMLNGAEIAYALGYALSDSGPDRDLLSEMKKGTLNDRAVMASQVERIYDQAILGTAKRKGKAERVLRFFQEYFAYERATDVFKDGSRHPGHHPRPADLIDDTNMLIEHVLKEDREVLRELLTTDLVYIRHVPTRPGWETVGSYNLTGKRVREDHLVSGDKNQNRQRYVLRLPGQRAGILTQPSWLTAHSTNFDNDPVRRGKWIYEHLLGGVIPDLPITVDATVPEDPDKTLRQRFEKTSDDYCLRCHRKMNPLGMAFEMYDDVGRFRLKELLRDNETRVAVDARGAIPKSGIPALEGDVENALDLLQKLADSPHVRQVFVRHAFRYWMGRNETLVDSPTLMAADAAFVQSGGSMKALVVSLLTSDSFLYRKGDKAQLEGQDQ